MQLLSKSQKIHNMRDSKNMFSVLPNGMTTKYFKSSISSSSELQWNLEIWLKMIHCYESVKKNRISFYFCSECKWTREHKKQDWKWYLYIWLELMISVRVKNGSVVKGFSQNHTIIFKLVLDRNTLLQHISNKLIIISNPWRIWQRQKW